MSWPWKIFKASKLGINCFTYISDPWCQTQTFLNIKQTTSLNPQRKNQFWKICTESWDISQNVSNFVGLVWKAGFGHFLVISWDSVRIFQNRFLHWNRELKSVVLSTINPINGTNIFFDKKGLAGFFLK